MQTSLPTSPVNQSLRSVRVITNQRCFRHRKHLGGVLRWCLVLWRSSMINVHSFPGIWTIKIRCSPCFCGPTQNDWTYEEASGHGGGSSRREAAADGAGGGGTISATRGHGTESASLIHSACCWLEKYNTWSQGVSNAPNGQLDTHGVSEDSVYSLPSIFQGSVTKAPQQEKTTIMYIWTLTNFCFVVVGKAHFYSLTSN